MRLSIIISYFDEMVIATFFAFKLSRLFFVFEKKSRESVHFNSRSRQSLTGLNLTEHYLFEQTLLGRGEQHDLFTLNQDTCKIYNSTRLILFKFPTGVAMIFSPIYMSTPDRPSSLGKQAQKKKNHDFSTHKP